VSSLSLSRINLGQHNSVSKLTSRKPNFHGLLIIHGDSGFGKTSIMAKAAFGEARKFFPTAIVIVRFCGTTPNSSTAFRLVESICIQLRALFHHAKLDIPSEYHQLVREFPKWLALATAERPIALFIDSLDSLHDEFASELRWLPTNLPENVFMVVSTIGTDCPAFKELRSRRSIIENKFIEVKELDPSEVAHIFDSWLEHDRKKLLPHQRQQLDVAANEGLTPLFLRLLYDRASKWRSFSAEEKLEKSTPELITRFLHRLEFYHGEPLVSHVFGLLAVSKYGLSTDEIIDMISSNNEVLKSIFQYHEPPQQRVPSLVIARLKIDCGEYMVERSAHGTTVLGWYHSLFWKITRERYSSQVHRREYFGKIIANYFMGELAKIENRGISPQPTWFESGSASGRTLNMRKITELPHALIKANMGQKVVEVLADLQWVEAVCASGQIRDLIADYFQSIGLFAVKYDPEHKLRRFLQFVKSDGDVLGQYLYFYLFILFS
jgi:hypothetical protein